MLAPRTHNSPPDPIDEAIAPFADAISEAEGWLDGAAVENEGQMLAVDALLSEIKSAIKAVGAGEESEAKPIYDEWKRVKARWKPTLDDLERIKKGLLAATDAFKRRLAADRVAAERKAREEADAARRAAEDAAGAASATDIEAQRAAAQAQADAEAAAGRLAAASAGKVKGLRKVHHHEIEDHRAALHWIARNDRDAVTAFVDEYVRKSAAQIDGVRRWTEREAY